MFSYSVFAGEQSVEEEVLVFAPSVLIVDFVVITVAAAAIAVLKADLNYQFGLEEQQPRD